MPYIAWSKRVELETHRQDSDVRLPENAGELNFEITKLILRYVRDPKVSYQRINDVIGVLECAKLEFYRRLASPYEDDKIVENGDVY